MWWTRMTKVTFANGPLEGQQIRVAGEPPIQLAVDDPRSTSPLVLSTNQLSYVRVGFAGDSWLYTFAGEGAQR